MTPKIVTECGIYQFSDWRYHCFAYYENDEPDDDGWMPMGHGSTRTEAVMNLIKNHPRPDVFCGERP